MTSSMEIRFIEEADNFKVYAKLNGIERLTKRATRRGMFFWARDLKVTANRRILAKDKTGRVYIRHFPSGAKRRHQSSAPGEYHANMTGKARKSIGWKVTGDDRLEFGYGVDGKDAPDYVDALEFGAREKISTSGSKTDAAAVGPRQFRMSPRPSIQNAIRDTTGNAETYFKEEIEKEFD